MSIFEMLGTVLLGPLKLVFEVIFSVANGAVNNPGLAIIALSLCMNTLLMPLYKRADAVQIEARDKEAGMKPVSDHIKKTFSGDERMMLLQTHYRQFNYSPLSALNGSVSLLLEIPFFMAAYQFLSNLDILNGVSFGPIADLSQPDGLIRFGALSINFLPILMTLINVVSSTLYLKGFPLKMKVQLYGMALLFLVLLYDSPAGLVFYWTLNNTYSLGKTLVNRIPHGGKILSGLLFLCGAMLALLRKTLLGGMHRRLVLMLGLLMMLPLAFILVKRFLPKREEKKMPKASTGMFVCGALFLTVLTGVLIPSTFIAASPLEYVDVTYFYHPVWYVVRSACMAAGTFMVWMSVFYWLMRPKAKVIFSRLVWILCGVMLVNYMFFGTDLGILSSALKYENDMRFGRTEILLNFAVILVLAVLMGLIHIRLSRSVGAVLLTGVLVLGGMSGIHTVKIMRAVQPVAEQAEIVSAQNPEITFSKDGENVAVIMIDRMMGLYLPYLVNEKPELLEQFDGFTFYPNTLSYGGTTNFASPALFGGYEYTPVELNRRDTESLASKQNEALKIMPILFSENGYDVTIFDPPYANYQWIPDLSIYDEYPEFKTCNTIGFYTALENKATAIENNKRNFFCFSIMKTMPVYFQTIIYDGGKYRQVASSEDTSIVQTAYDVSTADGIEELFLESYNTLVKLPEITKVTEESDKNFLLMSNKTTHEVTLLQEPEYIPAEHVDNTQYDLEHADRFTVDGKTLRNTEGVWGMGTYHIHMAAMMKLGDWLDRLRELGVYDNTKIILVADHGTQMDCFEEYALAGSHSETDYPLSIERFSPVLMVKDFGSTGFTMSDEFMTNADVPSLAFEGIIDDPVNPFTGKAINTDEKTAHDQYVILSNQWGTDYNNGSTFLPSAWASVCDDLRDPENWTFYPVHEVLQEHAAP